MFSSPSGQTPATADAPTFWLEGNIGSGKTTLGLRMAMELRYVFVPEDVNAALCKAFYADPARLGFGFQLFMLGQRKAWAEYHSWRGYTFLDRCLLGDYAFALWNWASGNLSSDDWALYQDMTCSHPCRLLAGLREEPVILYLNDSPDACRARALQRDPSTVPPLDYFRGIHAAYLILLYFLNGKRGRVYDWNDYANTPAADIIADAKAHILLIDKEETVLPAIQAIRNESARLRLSQYISKLSAQM